ncbi:MAG: galactose ABC transporter substrate-binding protein [Clostridia bacterium]|nr:galactose ABC transporter substrate-binding protein [Clostridia bacterium]
MKRLLAAALALFLCTGCGASNGGVRNLRVGICLYRQDDTFISLMAEDMQRAAKAIEQEKNVRLTLTFRDAQYSQTLQNEQASAFLEKGYDVLLVNVVDRTAAASLIDKAKSANTPIILFNREPVEEDLRRYDNAYYVGADAAESGTLEGKLLSDQYAADPASLDRNGDGRLQYVMLEGDQGHQDSVIRTEYVIKQLTEAGIKTDKLATGIANWQRVQASTKMALWLEQYGDRIEAVIANNDDMALGALDALDAAGITHGPAVVGIDGTPAGLEAVTARRMLGTVYNDAAGQSRNVIRLAYALAQNEGVDRFTLRDGKYLMSPYTIVTPINVSQYTP